MPWVWHHDFILLIVVARRGESAEAVSVESVESAAPFAHPVTPVDARRGAL